MTNDFKKIRRGVPMNIEMKRKRRLKEMGRETCWREWGKEWRNKVVGKERWEGRKNIIDMHG
jgi:hypothetical protein